MNDINTTVSKELQLRVESVVLNCLVKAQQRFGTDKVNKIPGIVYETKGRAAGKAHWNNGLSYININPILLNENVEEMLNQTVPHEVAHIVVWMVWGHFCNGYRVMPHGKEWKAVMHLFGLKADRCHALDISSIQKQRNTRHFAYKCNCQQHSISMTLHKRMVLTGKKYICKSCKGRLTFLGENIN